MESRNDAYVNAGFNTNSYKKTFVVTLGLFLNTTRLGTRINNGGFYVEWKPMSNLLVSAGPWVNSQPPSTRSTRPWMPDASASRPTATATCSPSWIRQHGRRRPARAQLDLHPQPEPRDLRAALHLERSVLAVQITGRARRPYTFDPYVRRRPGASDYRSLRGNAVIRCGVPAGLHAVLARGRSGEDYAPYEDRDISPRHAPDVRRPGEQRVHGGRSRTTWASRRRVEPGLGSRGEIAAVVLDGHDPWLGGVDQWGVLDVSGAAMWVLSADIDCVVEACRFPALSTHRNFDLNWRRSLPRTTKWLSISTASAAAISRLSLISSLPVVVMRSTGEAI